MHSLVYVASAVAKSNRVGICSVFRRQFSISFCGKIMTVISFSKCLFLGGVKI